VAEEMNKQKRRTSRTIVQNALAKMEIKQVGRTRSSSVWRTTVDDLDRKRPLFFTVLNRRGLTNVNDPFN
jgi:hypothetical protein